MKVRVIIYNKPQIHLFDLKTDPTVSDPTINRDLDMVYLLVTLYAIKIEWHFSYDRLNGAIRVQLNCAQNSLDP
jgi:hypothetical protein